MIGPIGPVRPPDGPRDISQAVRWADAYNARAAEPPTAEDRAGVTIREMFELHLAWMHREMLADRGSKSNYANRVLHLNHFAAFGDPPMADRPAASITLEDRDTFLRWAGTQWGPQFCRNIAASLSATWTWASTATSNRPALVPHHPFRGARKPPAGERPDRYVEDEQVAAAWKFASGLVRGRKLGSMDRRFDRQFLRLIWFILLTGCRPGDAAALRWEHLNWSKSIAVIPKHKTAKSTGKPRKIAITSRVRRMLRRMQADPKRHPDWVFTHQRGAGAAARGFHDPEQGEPWPNGTAIAAKILKWKKAAEKAGVDLGDLSKLTAYAGRYRWFTDWNSAGLPRDLGARVGGNSPAIVAAIYEQERDREAVAKAEEFEGIRRGKKG
jgi:integrase